MKKDDEYVSLNATSENKNQFWDTRPLNQLNTLVYYKVTALDNRYKESGMSDLIELRSPDKIPPAPPRIERVVAKENQIQIDWIKSFSGDVDGYIISKQTSSDFSKNWKIISQLTNRDSTFLDSI